MTCEQERRKHSCAAQAGCVRASRGTAESRALSRVSPVVCQNPRLLRSGDEKDRACREDARGPRTQSRAPSTGRRAPDSERRRMPGNEKDSRLASPLLIQASYSVWGATGINTRTKCGAAKLWSLCVGRMRLEEGAEKNGFLWPSKILISSVTHP